MKKMIALLLAVLMMATLCACGNEQPQETQPPVSQQDPTNGPAQQETEPVEEQPTDPEKTPFQLAEECIDKPLADLIALVGEPNSADYAPSCLNPGVGEDGNLYYDGFVVYTYREGSSETVQYVEETE